MSKILRAVLISAIATGTAVVLVNMIQHNNVNERTAALKGRANRDKFVDAEKLSEQEKKFLSDELDAML